MGLSGPCLTLLSQKILGVAEKLRNLLVGLRLQGLYWSAQQRRSWQFCAEKSAACYHTMAGESVCVCLHVYMEREIYIHIYIYIEGVCGYNHPKIDRIWDISGIHRGSFRDHVLSTPRWLGIHVYTYK